MDKGSFDMDNAKGAFNWFYPCNEARALTKHGNN